MKDNVWSSVLVLLSIILLSSALFFVAHHMEDFHMRYAAGSADLPSFTISKTRSPRWYIPANEEGLAAVQWGSKYGSNRGFFR